MSDAQLGILAPADADRDATHVAVVPMIAAMDMRPGEHVGVSGGQASNLLPPIGIVDPFLTETVQKGQRFYLCLYPRTVTGLRHVYNHPVLDAAEQNRQASEQWLRDFCASANCPGYESVIARAIEHQNDWDAGGGLHFNDDAYGEIPDEFWVHAEIVTGRTLTKRPTYFSCAC